MPTTLSRDDIALLNKVQQAIHDRNIKLTPVELIRLETLAKGGVSPSDPDYAMVQSVWNQYHGAPDTPAMRATATPSSGLATNSPISVQAPGSTLIPGNLNDASFGTLVNRRVKGAREILNQAQADQAGQSAAQQASDLGSASTPPDKPDAGPFGIIGQTGWQPTLDWVQNLTGSNQPTGINGSMGIDPNANSDDRLAQLMAEGPARGAQTTGLLDPSLWSDYTFGKTSATQRNMLFTDPAGPALEAMALAQQHGAGQSTAYETLPFVKAAMALASTGALGGPTSGVGANAGPQSTEYQLKAVEDLMRGASQPGAAFDPTTIMQTALTRLENTPQDQFSKMTALLDPKQPYSGQAADLGNPDDQIQATNNAMQAAGALGLGPQSQQNLQKVLAMAEIQYKQGLLNGSLSMTYPEYLDQIGIVQMFGG